MVKWLDYCLGDKFDEISNVGEYAQLNLQDKKTLEALLNPGIVNERFILRIIRR